VAKSEEKGFARFNSLGYRIAFGVGLILTASYALFVYLILDVQQDFYFEQAIWEADRLSEAVINATHNSMLRDDNEATRTIIRDMAQQEDISEIRIYDHDGVIKFSNNREELGATVDKQAEACFACHSADKPFSQVVTDKRARVHHHDDYRVLGMITPIYNEKSCYLAACHVHPKEQKVLGVLDMGISLQRFDTHAQSMVTNLVLLGVITCVLVLGTIGVYVALRVHRPLARLRSAAMSIALGDYNYKLGIDSRDEIGECAWAFRVMRNQIRRRTNELMHSREEFRTLFEQVPCFICVVNKDFEIVRQNSYMRKHFRGSTGMPCYQVFKKQKHKCDDCHVDIAFKEAKASGREHCGLTVSGEEANYVSYTTPIFDKDGNVVYAMLMAIDVGDRVQLERALDATKDFQTNLIESSIHGIVATNDQGQVTIYNLAAEKLFGYRAQEVVGDTDLEKYFPQQFVSLIRRSLHTGRHDIPKLVAHETTIRSKDRETVPVRFSGFVMTGTGDAAGAVGFYQDLRTFKQLERDKQASDRLAVVGQTVAGLAHGIKNILTGLEGGVFVVETALDEDDKQLLKRGWSMVNNNVNRIAQLVKDLLSYSKERAPQFEETDANHLAEEVCALFEVSARERGIEIHSDFDPDVGRVTKVFLDPRGIHTCLSNLVSNAMDACTADTEKERHHITMRTRQAHDGSLILQVSDDGAGMNDETRRKIFAGFYSTKGSRGTGLGLLVTHKIVMEHGGDIEFKTEEGVGTTFTITLPPRKHSEVIDGKNNTPVRDSSSEESIAETAV
jgi:histidine kinase